MTYLLVTLLSRPDYWQIMIASTYMSSSQIKPPQEGKTVGHTLLVARHWGIVRLLLWNASQGSFLSGSRGVYARGW